MSPGNQGVFQLMKEVTCHWSTVSVSGNFTPSRATVAVCQNSGKNRVLDVRARLFGGFSDTVLLNLLELS